MSRSTITAILLLIDDAETCTQTRSTSCFFQALEVQASAIQPRGCHDVEPSSLTRRASAPGFQRACELQYPYILKIPRATEKRRPTLRHPICMFQLVGFFCKPRAAPNKDHETTITNTWGGPNQQITTSYIICCIQHLLTCNLIQNLRIWCIT